MYLLLKRLLAITTNFFKHVSLLIFHDYLYLFCLLFIVIGTNSQIPVNTPDQFLIGDFYLTKIQPKQGAKGQLMCRSRQQKVSQRLFPYVSPLQHRWTYRVFPWESQWRYSPTKTSFSCPIPDALKSLSAKSFLVSNGFKFQLGRFFKNSMTSGLPTIQNVYSIWRCGLHTSDI